MNTRLVMIYASFVFIFCTFLCSCNITTDKSIKEELGDSNLNRDTVANLNRDTLDIPNIASGIYQDISLAYDSIGKTITGVYQYYDNWDENYKEYLDVNVFYFFGVVNYNVIINVKGAWPTNNQQINGKLFFHQRKDSNYIKLFLDKQPLGYNNVDFTKNDGVLMNIDNPKKWIQVRIIKSPVARLYSLPDSSTARKGYLVKNDIVKILSKNIGGWDNIEYNPKNDNMKSTVLWLREEDLYNIDPNKW